ncbi:copper resistance D family protein [Spiribacter pallidus]|uniref:copper resistance D family protein n=1 Tax=Spiribacter pallidus TaxID=1987936 RepID=UPI0034A06ABE
MTLIEASIVAVKALAYASGIVAAGQLFCLWLIHEIPADEELVMRSRGAGIALLALVLAWALIGLEAVFLAGGQWQAFVDPALWGFVLDGPNGLAMAGKSAGLMLVMIAGLPGRTAAVAGLAGAVLFCAAFTMTGHVAALSNDWFQVLLLTHLLCLGFWLGVFPPLYRLSGTQPQVAGAIGEVFGRRAMVAVGLLVITGAATLTRILGNPLAATTTPYGQLFALKLGIFVLVMAAAAVNKRRLTPALQRGESKAGRRMQRSLLIEGALIGAVLVVTSAFTTLTGPA